MKICDNKSVGMFVWRDDKLLLIERGRFPFGFAVPAGHVDEDKTFEEAAIRELREEVGLNTEKIELLVEGKKDNICRRNGGSWHYWKLYKISTTDDINRSKEETKNAIWCNKDKIKELAEKTKKYLEKEINEEDWIKNPGLEPVMFEWFKELKII